MFVKKINLLMIVSAFACFGTKDDSIMIANREKIADVLSNVSVLKNHENFVNRVESYMQIQSIRNELSLKNNDHDYDVNISYLTNIIIGSLVVLGLEISKEFQIQLGLDLNDLNEDELFEAVMNLAIQGDEKMKAQLNDGLRNLSILEMQHESGRKSESSSPLNLEEMVNIANTLQRQSINFSNKDHEISEECGKNFIWLVEEFDRIYCDTVENELITRETIYQFATRNIEFVREQKEVLEDNKAQQKEIMMQELFYLRQCIDDLRKDLRVANLHERLGLLNLPIQIQVSAPPASSSSSSCDLDLPSARSVATQAANRFQHENDSEVEDDSSQEDESLKLAVHNSLNEQLQHVQETHDDLESVVQSELQELVEQKIREDVQK
jgi:hypothetical protein